MNNLLVSLALITVSTLYSISFIVNKFVMDKYPPAALVLIRVVGAALVLTLILNKQIVKHWPNKKQWLNITLMSVLGIVLNLIFFMEGLKRTSATHSALIGSVIPMAVLVFAWLFKYEQLSKQRFLGILLSLCGVWLTLWASKSAHGEATFLGDFLTLINITCFSLYLTLSRRLNQSTPPLIVTWGMMVIGQFLLFPYAAHAFLNLPWSQLSQADWFAFAFIVLGGTVATYYLNNWALARVESSYVGIYILLQPVLTSVLDWIYRGQTLSNLALCACLLIISGVILGSVRRKGRGKRSVNKFPA